MVIATSTTLLPNFVYNVGCHLRQNVAQFCVAKVIIDHKTVLCVYGTGRGVQAFRMLAAAQLRHTIVTKYQMISLGYVRVLKENTDPILYKQKEHNNIEKNIVIPRQRKDCGRISSGTKHKASSRCESTDIVSYYYHLIVRNLMELWQSHSIICIMKVAQITPQSHYINFVIKLN
jgi:hypothetical protein